MATLLGDILTPAWLKEQYLAGVDWTDQFGVALPDSIIEEAIRMAIARAEADFDISILPVQRNNERQDVAWERAPAWWPITTRRRPLLAKPTIKLRLGPIELYTLPASWVYLDMPRFGRMHIVPLVYEQVMQQSQVIVPALRMFFIGNYAAGGWEMDYTAGFLVQSGTVLFAAGETTKEVTFAEELAESDYRTSFALVNPDVADAGIVPGMSIQGTAGFTIELDSAPTKDLTVRWTLHNLPADLMAYIGLRAAIPPLNTAGATLVAPGVASKSTSVDGLAQSVTSTQNAQSLAYGNRVMAYNQMAEELKLQIAGKWRAPHLMVM